MKKNLLSGSAPGIPLKHFSKALSFSIFPERKQA